MIIHSSGAWAGARALLFAALACCVPTVGRAQWAGHDVGPVAAAGHSSIDGSTFTVAGSGADIWNGSDACQFFAEPFAGDGAITARIIGRTDTNGWAKAGIMIRDTLDANAPNVFLAATPEWHGVVAQQRSTTGSDTTIVQSQTANAPYWLRITRTGTQLVAATSPDGTTWTTLGNLSASISTASAYFGLAVTSHNDGTLCTATFDNVSVVPNSSQPSTPPSAPTNLAATTYSSTQISLSWATTNTNTQNGFQIERSTDNATFAQIALAYAGDRSFLDRGLTGSTLYYYRVRATNSAGASSYSNVASATTNAAPPPASGNWQSADIGTTTAGQSSATADAVTLTGSGRDIWNGTDGLRYYYQPTPSGDCEVIVRVSSVQDTNGWAKAGIMLRESLDPGSAQAWVCVSAEHGVAFQWRESTGGDTQTSTPSEDGGPPRWLKLVFKAPGTDEPIPARIWSYVSADGANWTSVANLYPNSAWHYIGLAVTSHNDGTLCTAQFDHLSFLTPPPAPTGLQVTHRGPNGEIDLAWSYATSDVDRFEIQSNADKPSNHDWITIGIVPGGTRQTAVYGINSTDGDRIQIAAFRDSVQGTESSWGIVRATDTPSLSLNSTTSSSISLRVTESYGYSGAQSGPWSIERSSDNVNFAEIVSGLQPTGGSTYSDYADYTDSGLPSGVTRYYRARQRLTNGDISGYSSVLSATTSTTSGPPAAPTNLTAFASTSTSVKLTWTNHSTDEEYFDIGRSTDNATFFSVGRAAAHSTDYTDTTASPGTAYYYGVAAFKNGAGASSNIATVTTPSSPTGSSWISQDIGNPGAHGSASANSSGDSVTVSGSGPDMWGTADSGQFAYQALNGVGTLTARVASITDTNGWAKAGLMIRDSFAAGARNIFLAATPEWHGIVGQHRDTTNGSTLQVAGPGLAPPCWLRLARSSDQIHLSTSSDGVTWTEFASWASSLINTNAYIGFAVTSHNDGALCTATFDHVTLATGTGPVGTPLAPSNLSANPLSSTQVELVWSDNSTNESGFSIGRATNAAGPFTLITTTAANTRRYVDSSLSPMTTYWYIVGAVNSNGVSGNSNMANATTPSSNGPTSAPTLTASATGAYSIALSWTPSGSGQFTWVVERSTDGVAFGQAFTTASSTTSVTDTNILAGTKYYYRVRSTDGGGVGPYSNIASATTTEANASWSAADIGAVGRAGSNNASGNTITINGAGADIWGGADAFYFVWQTRTGDGVVEAQVASMTNTDGWAKAGVMIRESANANAPNVFVALTPTWHGIVAQARSAAGGDTTQTAGPAQAAPYWVKLVRSGSTFTASTSPNGTTWTTFATFNVAMSATAQFGFAVTSHDTSQLNQAVFQDPFVGAP